MIAATPSHIVIDASRVAWPSTTPSVPAHSSDMGGAYQTAAAADAGSDYATAMRVLSREAAADFLVGHHRLRAVRHHGDDGVRRLLGELRCIQVDPLDRIGTNADLVVLARVDGVRRGAIWDAVYPGHAFEHFAKERCLLPAYAFPYYRDQAAETPWWRLATRLERLPAGVVERVLDEVRARGPLTAADLADHGRVEPLDWQGWKGTGKAASMALEVLWTRCQVVVSGRRRRGRVYDVPERALPDVAARPAGAPFARFALLERVEAAGLLSTASGPHWSMLASVRTSPLPDALVAEGVLERVGIEGTTRTWLAPAGFLDRVHDEDDVRMRILGPLDPLLWDRALVRHVFGFDYVWEVYKPASERIWGWYVCPLLHRGRLVGRLEAKIEGGRLRVDRLWREDGARLDRRALGDALERHAAACDAKVGRIPREARCAG